MRNLIFSIATLISMTCYSQINFEAGYFINEEDQKIECLIKNTDWKDNPTQIQYKLAQSEEIKMGSLQTVKEFSINETFKYIRATVKIDRSPNDLSKMGTDRNPVFQEEQLFLKVLIEGSASLFFYQDGNLVRFFYKTNDTELSQLVSKNYLTRDNKMAENNFFRQQLFNSLKCQEITERDLKDIDYKNRALEKLFIKYNKCNNSSFVQYGINKLNSNFHLAFRPRVNFNSLSIHDSEGLMDTDFGKEQSFQFGLEAEVPLRFNNNKWTVIIEPTLQSFNSDKVQESSVVSGGYLITEVELKSIEIPVGIRHYFFLSGESRIFLNASLLFNINYNSSLEFLRADGSTLSSIKVTPFSNSMAFGMGYSLKGKYGLEIRYQTGREILDVSDRWSSDFKTVGIIFSLRLL